MVELPPDVEPARLFDRCREPITGEPGIGGMATRPCDLRAFRRFMGTPLCSIHFWNVFDHRSNRRERFATH